MNVMSHIPSQDNERKPSKRWLPEKFSEKQLKAYRVDALRIELRKKDLPTKGRKDELVARILEYQEKNPQIYSSC